MFREKGKIFLLLLIICFLLVLGFFTFDYYGLIDGDEIFPFLAKKPSLVNWDKESPTEIEKLEFKKQREKLDEEFAEIEKMRENLKAEQEKLQADSEKIDEMKKSIKDRENEILMRKKDEESRAKKLKVLANKIANMPPVKAKELLMNWPDQDIIDVFKQMDKDAEDEGTTSITTYLLTLFDEKRRAVISNKWLDHEADRIPDPYQTAN